ncbi:hypothetical protein BUALT_Bualt02G0159900 [Buddleja alternifolia]|uniref:Mitochondrial import inner membrane translocase subunit TIM50 n=1 Tax=Buddleja alternifolia TaxID=168488 RepID=A0AAV6Y7C4_9LAMI|nr:hypothetical protein BUALT_Bualt02G0159900 [Buddleja alternifolia]
MTGTSEVLEQDDDDLMLTYQRKKRIKTGELSDISTTDSEINIEETGTSSHGQLHRISTSLDQPVEFDSVRPCQFKSMSENSVISEEGIPTEVVENKVMEEPLDFEKSLSNNGDKVVIDKSNGITNENRDADMPTSMLPEENPDGTENDVILNVVSAETQTNEFPSRDPSLQLDNKEQSFPVSSAAVIIDRRSCDEDILANKPLEELDDEAKVIAEETSEKLPILSSGDDDPSSSQLDGLKCFASQVVNESESVNVDRGFSVCMRKKLLVLDVNGLLIDICSYVPYDYDWDDIILKKAVFKRPYCDDFLKFCFERFNVGIWSSKTKRNMEPIIDFLLGDGKRNLLFTWDQSHCTYTGFNTVEKRHKPLLLKKLKKLWDKCEPDLPWERGEYNESNTLLIDDSPYKALCNPRYTAIFPYTYRFRDLRDNALGPRGDLRVYLEGLATTENVQEYVKQNPFGQRPITERNLSWGFYLKVIQASSSPPRQTGDEGNN